MIINHNLITEAYVQTSKVLQHWGGFPEYETDEDGVVMGDAEWQDILILSNYLTCYDAWFLSNYYSHSNSYSYSYSYSYVFVFVFTFIFIRIRIRIRIRIHIHIHLFSHCNYHHQICQCNKQWLFTFSINLHMLVVVMTMPNMSKAVIIVCNWYFLLFFS